MLINFEEEIFLRDYLIVGALGKFFSTDLIFELDEADLLLHHLIDPLADVLEMLRASSLAEGLVSAWHGRVLFQGVEIGGLRLIFLSSLLHRYFRVLPQCHNVIVDLGG